MDEIRGVVSFVATGFIWLLVIAATLALLVILTHGFTLTAIGNGYSLGEAIAGLFSIGVLYVFAPLIRR